MRLRKYAVPWVLLMLLMTALACNLTPSDDNNNNNTSNTSNVSTGNSVPTVTILNPPTTATVNVPLEIQVEARVDSGSITSVELYVNQVRVNLTIASGANPYNTTLTWTPRIPGTVTMSVVASSNTQISSSQEISVVISNTPVTDPGSGSNNTGGSGGSTSFTPNAPDIGPCRALMTVALRFRSVPDTSSADTIIRTFNINEEAPIQGRLGDNSWFQVRDNVTGQTGWVFYNNSDGDFFTLIGSCISVPVLENPVVTQVPIPTSTPAPTISSSPADLVALPISGNTNLQLSGGVATGSYSLRIQNVGGTNSGPFRVLVVLPGGQEITRDVANLGPNESVSVADADQQTVTFSSAGTFQISILADFEDTIPESNEGNNFASISINVTAP